MLEGRAGAEWDFAPGAGEHRQKTPQDCMWISEKGSYSLQALSRRRGHGRGGVGARDTVVLGQGKGWTGSGEWTWEVGARGARGGGEGERRRCSKLQTSQLGGLGLRDSADGCGSLGVVGRWAPPHWH